MKQNATAEQLKQRKTLAAAEREENQRFRSSSRLKLFKTDDADEPATNALFSLFRMIVCNQVMKFLLDKIEKDEKQAAKKRKKEEVVEQKRSKQNATKLTALLYKHKEHLKAEILKKRALLDKELQLQVQVSTSPAFSNIFFFVYRQREWEYSCLLLFLTCAVSLSGGAEAGHNQAAERERESSSCYCPGCCSNSQGCLFPVFPLLPTLSLHTFLSQHAHSDLTFIVPQAEERR